jgi:hypothetical protein
MAAGPHRRIPGVFGGFTLNLDFLVPNIDHGARGGGREQARERQHQRAAADPP